MERLSSKVPIKGTDEVQYNDDSGLAKMTRTAAHILNKGIPDAPSSSLSTVDNSSSSSSPKTNTRHVVIDTSNVNKDTSNMSKDNDQRNVFQEPSQKAKGKQKQQVPELETTDLKAITSLTNKQRAFLVKGGFISTAEVLFTPLRPLSERLRLPENECRDLVKNIVNERKKRWIGNGKDTAAASLSVGTRIRRACCSQGQSSVNGEDVNIKDHSTSFSQLPVLWPGDKGLKQLVGGGLVPGTLTEIAGEASSGKTALALQLALRVQLDPLSGGLGGSCVYLSSEGNFPSTRLRDMAFKLSDGMPDGIKVFMDNVHLVHCPEVDELLHAVRYSLPAVVHQLGHTHTHQGSNKEPSTSSTSSPSSCKPVKLVIVDSIAAPFRGSEGGGGASLKEPRDGKVNGQEETSEGRSGMYPLVERNKTLAEIAAKLYRLAQQYSLVVVLVNQVSDVFQKDGHDSSNNLGQAYSQNASHSQGQSRGEGGTAANINIDSHENGGLPLDYRNYKHASRFFTGEEADSRNGKVAVFGLNWANCINTRIMLSRTGRRRRKLDGVEVQALVTLDEHGLEIEDPLFALETEEVRRATLIFSPFADKGYIDYVLRQEGLVSFAKYRGTPRCPSKRVKRQANKGTRKSRTYAYGVNSLSKPDDLERGTEDEGTEDEIDEEDDEDALWAELSREGPELVLDEATLSQLG